MSVAGVAAILVAVLVPYFVIKKKKQLEKEKENKAPKTVVEILSSTDTAVLGKPKINPAIVDPFVNPGKTDPLKLSPMAIKEVGSDPSSSDDQFRKQAKQAKKKKVFGMHRNDSHSSMTSQRSNNFVNPFLEKKPEPVKETVVNPFEDSQSAHSIGSAQPSFEVID